MKFTTYQVEVFLSAKNPACFVGQFRFLEVSFWRWIVLSENFWKWLPESLVIKKFVHPLGGILGVLACSPAYSWLPHTHQPQQVLVNNFPVEANPMSDNSFGTSWSEKVILANQHPQSQATFGMSKSGVALSLHSASIGIEVFHPGNPNSPGFPKPKRTWWPSVPSTARKRRCFFSRLENKDLYILGLQKVVLKKLTQVFCV